MTTRQKSPNPPERHFDDHSVIVPPHNLRGVVKQTREPGNIDMSVVAKAEAALQELKGEFGSWMQSECDRLDAARRVIATRGLNRSTANGLFIPAHDIKGGASTLGFPLAERIASSLCRLLKYAPEPTRISLKLVDHHVDTIRAVVREGVEDEHNPYGLQIAEQLAVLVETFLSHELQDGYAEIAADAAPRIEIPERR